MGEVDGALIPREGLRYHCVCSSLCVMRSCRTIYVSARVCFDAQGSSHVSGQMSWLRGFRVRFVCCQYSRSCAAVDLRLIVATFFIAQYQHVTRIYIQAASPHVMTATHQSVNQFQSVRRCCSCFCLFVDVRVSVCVCALAGNAHGFKFWVCMLFFSCFSSLLLFCFVSRVSVRLHQ